jgi:molybdopterin-guanine dinucleotide biosynthesis protein A
MGHDKSLLVVDGDAMAVRVARAMRDAGAAEVFAVGGDLDALRAAGLDARKDEYPGEGPLGGIISALREARDGASAVAVIACDVLDPSAAVIRSLVAEQERSSAVAVVPAVDGRPQWLHAVWGRPAHAPLARAFSRGVRAVTEAAAGVDGLSIVALDDTQAAALADADTPDDVERWRTGRRPESGR